MVRPTNPEIHGRRVNHHVEVLQQRIESGAVGRVLREVGRKRVVVHDHQEEEEHLHNRDDRNDVRNELAMALAIDVHRDGTEHRQQCHPEHDRAVEPAPVRRQLVEEGLCRIRIALDVLDRIVAGDEGVHDHGRRGSHDRRHEVEGADSAFDQRTRAAPGTTHRNRGRVGADNECGEQQVVAQGCHVCDSTSAARRAVVRPPRTSTDTSPSCPWP